MNRKLLLLLTIFISISTAAIAQTIVGITINNYIFRIPSASSPGAITAPVAITGINSGQDISGADFRPGTGQLYLLGYNSASGAAQLYTADYISGIATPVNATPVTLALGNGSVSFDFNPAADRIRVVGSNGKNYRLNPVTGAIAATDADLTYAVGDANAASTPAIGAAAYSNSYIGSDSTMLYDYDEVLNVLATQNPPNNGTLNTLGASGITVNIANRRMDMDIWTDPLTTTNKAFLTANTGQTTDNLYTVNLTTGAATLIGPISGIGLAVKDIAAVIENPPLPPLTGQLIFALTKTNRNLISFDSDQPALLRAFRPISGLTAGQTLAGIDVRPADRKLYGLGYNSSNLSYQVYHIDTVTGNATALNATPGNMLLGTGTNIGFDFNPVQDVIRVVSSNGANYRLNATTGTLVMADTILTYAAGDVNMGRPARVGSIAYTNSYADASSTNLYGIDDTISTFLAINPPNSGYISSITTLTGLTNPADLTTDIDFYFNDVSSVNVGYLATNPGSSYDRLYTITETGTTVEKGFIGIGVPVADIAVQIRYGGPNSGIRHKDASMLQAFPNPVYDKLTLQLPQGNTERISITVTNTMGQMVLGQFFNINSETIEVDVRDLPQGIYFVSVSGSKNNYLPLKIDKR